MTHTTSTGSNSRTADSSAAHAITDNYGDEIAAHWPWPPQDDYGFAIDEAWHAARSRTADLKAG